MTRGQTVELTRHRLDYLPVLQVSREFFEHRFSVGCSMANCDASCCRHGVMADVREREIILKHAELIIRYLEPDQVRDPERWFDGRVEDDPDFPSGKAVGTRTSGRGCVFLDSIGRCVLQKAATAEGLPRFSLKPFFCTVYPLTIADGQLTIDDPEFVDRDSCCSIRTPGTLSVFDVCREELEFMLGAEGVAELQGVEQRFVP